MLKIVIAEDVELERDGLVQNIRWGELGMTVVGAAADGREAWEMIEEHRPDMVLTDIMMPVRDGIELAKQVAAAYPSTKILFFSGQEDFNLAVQAIKSKVCEYVLKPYTLREITNALRKVAEQCRQEQEKSREERLIKNKLEETKPLLQEKLLRDIVYGLITDEKVLQEMLRLLDIRPAHHSFALMLLSVEQAREPDFAQPPELFDAYAQARISETLRELGDHSARCTQRVNPSYCDAEGGILSLFKCRDGEFVLLLNEEGSKLSDKVQLERFGMTLKAALETHIGAEVMVCVSNPVGHLLHIAQCYKEMREARKLAQLAGKDRIIFYEDLNDANAFNRMNKIVQAVKRIIHAKYMEQITLNDIAAEVFMSPNYVNSIFKKMTGTNINKYLIEVRIANAVEQLGKADAVIGRVSESVGYKNFAHFSTLFKKHTGLTPLEYRENNVRI